MHFCNVTTSRYGLLLNIVCGNSIKSNSGTTYSPHLSEFNQNVVTLLVKAAVATNKSYFT